MTEPNRQFDDAEQHVSPQFRKDLRALFKPPGAVPQKVDGTVLDQARRRLTRPRRLIIPIRWAAVAAAAVIVLGVVLLNPQSEIRNPKSTGPARADVDSNGRVDILDAFRLARDIESRGQVRMQWDLNSDGLVDRKDVDVVAFAAVRLEKGV